MSTKSSSHDDLLAPGLSFRAGDILGRGFRIESLIHADSAVALLAGTELATNEKVSIEVLVACDLSAEPVEPEPVELARLNFLRNARKVTAVEGPHLARVLEVGIASGGEPFVVREEGERHALADSLASDRTLACADAVDIAVDICDALADAHSHGVVHGNVSPDLVRLVWTPEGPTEVLLLGLGTARAVLELRARLPFDPALAETLLRRAPEQLEENPVLDGQVDVWGVGALLYTLLSGASPFAAESASGVNLALLLEEAPAVAGIPDDLAEVLETCLAKNPERRPRTVAALATALAPFVSESRKELVERVAARARQLEFLEMPDDALVRPTLDLLDLALVRKMNGRVPEPVDTAPREVIAAGGPLDLVIEVEASEVNVGALVLEPQVVVDPSSPSPFEPSSPSVAPSSPRPLLEPSTPSVITDLSADRPLEDLNFDDTETSRRIGPTLPPVALSVPPPAMLAPLAKSRVAPAKGQAWRIGLAAAGVAGVAALLFVGAQIARPRPGAAGAAVTATPPLPAQPMPPQVTDPIAEDPSPSIGLTTISRPPAPPPVAPPAASSVGVRLPPPRPALPPVRPLVRPLPSPTAAPDLAATAASKASTPTSPSTTPPTPPTSTQPQSKDSEDELHRFLDDRR